MLVFILWATIVGPLVSAEAYDSCYANVSDPYVLFSTYTAYEFVHNNRTDPVNIPNCQPLQFWMLSRHGTRYSDEDDIDNMWSLKEFRDQIISNIRDGRGELCIEDVDNLKKWTPQAVTSVADNLTPQGYKDAYYVAQRYASRFPKLLNQSYCPHRFQVRFTDTQRTTLTAFAFIDGLFGSTVNVKLPKPFCIDPLLKPSDYCTLWDEKVNHNPASEREAELFKNGPEVAAVRRNVSARLGFELTISYDELDKIYTICRFEKAWHVDRISPWCAAFTEDELKVLEYKEDLESYYRHGYGNKMNKHVACYLARDFLLRFSELEKGERQPAGVFYFSHDTDMQLFFTALGFANDSVPPTHSNYKSMGGRKWRTSLLTPFASNFVAVFFKCDEGEPFRVQFRLQEWVLKLDDPYLIRKRGLYDWSAIKEKYAKISETCNLDFCFI